MESEVLLDPIKEISYILESNGYGKNLRVGHITYDNKINKDYQYQIIRESTHDGTAVFTQGLIFKALSNLINKQSYYKGNISEDQLSKVKDVNYMIGDIKLETEYGVKAEFGAAIRQVVSIPVKVEYEFK
jgi:hypothetical protein